MKPTKSKSLCSGCYNNDYNFGLGGAKECWAYKPAKIIKRLGIPVDMSPPYDAKAATYRMSCFRKPRMVYVDPKVLTKEGFWRS